MTDDSIKASRVVEIAAGILLAVVVIAFGCYLSSLDWRTSEQIYQDQLKQGETASESIRSMIEAIEAGERYEKMTHEEKMRYMSGESPATD